MEYTVLQAHRESALLVPLHGPVDGAIVDG